MGFPKFLTRNDMKPIEERLTRIESRQDTCDIKHEGHNRRHDDAANNHAAQTKLLERIVEKLEAYEPTIKRSASNQTAFDAVLRWAGGGTVLLGLISALAAAVVTVKGLF